MIKPFEMSHLDEFTPKYHTPHIDLIMKGNLYEENRIPLSIIINGEVIALCGVNLHQPAVGEVWLIPGENIEKYPMKIVKHMKWLLHRFLFDELKMRRIIMHVKMDWEKGVKWARLLGFLKEGVARCYDSECNDHYIYSIVRYGWQPEQQ